MNTWHSLSRTTRAVVVALAVALALDVLLGGLRSLTGGTPGGPTSSSFATGGDGLAAYAELLRQHGHQVVRLRDPVDQAAALEPGDTLVIADPAAMEPAEADAVARFVRAGGRLVAAGPRVDPALRRLLGTGLDWSSRGASTAVPLLPQPEVADVASVRAGGTGSYRGSGGGLPALAAEGDDRRVLAVVADVDRGRVVALADASVLQNASLDRDGNAAFGLAAAGDPMRTVRFAEEAHGFTRGTGLGALPSSWKRAMAVAALAGLGWMWSKGRRFGPPDEVERQLAPPRRAYVDAMAASLSKVRQPGRALAPLQQAARTRVARRAGLAPDAGDDALRAAARRLGLPDDEIDALTAVPGRDEDVLAVGRVAARVEGSTW